MSAFPPVPVVEGAAAPLIRANVDTDAIIPSRKIKGVGKTGLAQGLFAGWRARPGFVLDDPAFANAPILLGGENFGCGSSREHAVWALHEWGFRAVIAPSFAPIFRGNCVRNGIVPVVLDAAAVEAMAGESVRIDLAAQRATCGERHWHFEIEDEAKAMLMEGLDAIDLTLKHGDAIAAFHARDRAARPWVYLEKTA